MHLFEYISRSLLIAVMVQISCQIFKFIFYSVKDGRINLKYAVSAGGMPSAHSAFVTALTTAVGLNAGFQSEAFAVAFVFAVIIIHDSFRVRSAIEIHARVLEKITKKAPEKERYISKEKVGHNPAEMLAGVVYGLVMAFLLHVLLSFLVF